MRGIFQFLTFARMKQFLASELWHEPLTPEILEVDGIDGNKKGEGISELDASDLAVSFLGDPSIDPCHRLIFHQSRAQRLPRRDLS